MFTKAIFGATASSNNGVDRSARYRLYLILSYVGSRSPLPKDDDLTIPSIAVGEPVEFLIETPQFGHFASIGIDT